MPFTWTFDAPTGTYKSHELSSMVLYAAIEDTVFVEHATMVEGFGKKQGETVTFPRVSNITEPTSGQLSENQRIPEDTIAVTTKGVTVKELGRSVPFTSFAQDLSSFDLENAIQRKLRNQMSLVQDTIVATGLKRTKLRYTPTGVTSFQLGTTGAFLAQATANMGTYHLSQIHDILYDTYQAPEITGGGYVGIFRQLSMRGIMDDPNWETWHQYTDPQAKYNSEAGRYEDIRLMKTNHNKALGKVGAASILGEGLVFGANAVAMAEAMTPELRAGIPQDLGRSRIVGWYGIIEADIYWDTANPGEANIVYVGST